MDLKKMKLATCGILLATGVCGSVNVEASINSNQVMSQQVATSVFTDVKANHYAYEAILWAQNKGIVSGYGDGRFGPNDAVTEAQFAKMISNYFNIKDTYGNLTKTTKATHWSDGDYDALAQFAVPLNGYFDNSIRNKPIKRGLVAQVLTYIAGYRTNLTGSIEFLLDNNITSGQNPQHKDSDLMAFFGSTNNLTRAQVVAFLHRMELEGLNSVSEGIEKPDGKDINTVATIGKERVDHSLSQGTTSNIGIVIPSNFNEENVVSENKADNSITIERDGLTITVNNPAKLPPDYVKVPEGVFVPKHASYRPPEDNPINLNDPNSLVGISLGINSSSSGYVEEKAIRDFEGKIPNTVGQLADRNYIYQAASEERIWISNLESDGVGFIKIENGHIKSLNQGESVDEMKLFVSLAADYFDVSISYKDFEDALQKTTGFNSSIEIRGGVYLAISDVGILYFYKR